MVAVRLSARKASRAFTNVALGTKVSMQSAKGTGGIDVRHQRHCDAVEKQSCERNETGQGGAETTAAGEESSEEGHDREKQGDQVENPSESPHVEVVHRSRVSGIGPGYNMC